MDFLNNLWEIFSNGHYMLMFLKGFGTTLLISFFAALLGLILGTVVAMVNISEKSKLMAVPKAICKTYVTIIRGTPMALQLFLIALVIFKIRGFPEIIKAVLAFGINSGAYVAESIRGGILSVDIGQTEAGRSLGLTSRTTMFKIVIPQAVKNVIPAIGNELIALVKETSIVTMIGMYDLTKVAQILSGGVYLSSYLAPTVVAACFYLAIVYLISFVIKKVEARLRVSDKR